MYTTLKVLTIGLLAALATPAVARDADFERDRQAILAMAGEFEVRFKFDESLIGGLRGSPAKEERPGSTLARGAASRAEDLPEATSGGRPD